MDIVLIGRIGMADSNGNKELLPNVEREQPICNTIPYNGMAKWLKTNDV